MERMKLIEDVAYEFNDMGRKLDELSELLRTTRLSEGQKDLIREQEKLMERIRDILEDRLTQYMNDLFYLSE